MVNGLAMLNVELKRKGREMEYGKVFKWWRENRPHGSGV